MLYTIRRNKNKKETKNMKKILAMILIMSVMAMGFSAVVDTATLTVEITLGDLENGSDVMKYGTTFDTAHGNAGLLVLSGDVHSLVVPASTGLQIYNFPFQVSITNAQYSSSIPNSYSATIMFKYTSL